MSYIYDAGTQTRKVRILAWFALALFLGGLAAGAAALGDGEAAGAALLVVSGGLFLALILFFLDHYACGLSVDFEALEIEIDTPRMIGERSRVYPLDALRGAAYQAGETTTIWVDSDIHGIKHHVRAPYVKLRVQGRRWPFIIDMQGYIADEAGFARLLSGIGAFA